jgi:hypothetical protein
MKNFKENFVEMINNDDKRKFTEELLRRYTYDLRNYMRDSHNNIGFDDREDEEFVEIFVEDMKCKIIDTE